MLMNRMIHRCISYSIGESYKSYDTYTCEFKMNFSSLLKFVILFDLSKLIKLNHFQRVLYSHVKRNGNSVAHSLAKHAISILDLQEWEDVPSHIISFLYLDVTHFH